MIVYGNIFTSEAGDFAESFAVKDGKYIFVGSAADAEKYKDEHTEIVKQPENGMVMAGCTEGHGHYFMSEFYECGKFVLKMNAKDGRQEILDKVKAIATRGPKPDYIYGYGFNYLALKEHNDFPTRSELDAILDDIPIYLADGEGHKGIANTCCFKAAGIIDNEEKVIPGFKYDDYILKDGEGRPTGLLLEQAGTYVRSHGCVPTDGVPEWTMAIRMAQEKLNSMGYTAAFEGWANKFGMQTYVAAKQMDQNNELKLNLAMAYEIENIDNDYVLEEIEKASLAQKKYSSTHIKPDFIKLFEDGTPETGTGYMMKDGKDGHGHPIWQQPELENLVLAANRKGLNLHVHAMGDAAVHEVVNAFEASCNKGNKLRNQIVHLRNVTDEDFVRMASCGIVTSCGVSWHRLSTPEIGYLLSEGTMNEEYVMKGYPYQSFIANGVHNSISTDAPATAGAPSDPFGIMEVAVTGRQAFGDYDFKEYDTETWDAEECAKDRKDFLRSLTIEGAYQMYCEKTRGSIAVGKYADFIIINQDVLSCKEDNLHNTKVVRTYFEGTQVYPR